MGLDAQAGIIMRRAATCATPADACTGQDDSWIDIAAASARVWNSSLFVADATDTICSLTARLSETGTFPNNLIACIYTDDGVNDFPSTEVSCSTNTVGTAEIPASVGDVSFTGLSAAVTSGTKYHVVIHSTGAADAANFVSWYYENADCLADGENTARSADGISWVLIYGTAALEFQGYK